MLSFKDTRAAGIKRRRVYWPMGRLGSSPGCLHCLLAFGPTRGRKRWRRRRCDTVFGLQATWPPPTSLLLQPASPHELPPFKICSGGPLEKSLHYLFICLCVGGAMALLSQISITAMNNGSFLPRVPPPLLTAVGDGV